LIAGVCGASIVYQLHGKYFVDVATSTAAADDDDYDCDMTIIFYFSDDYE
jgi:hypothetical protein